MLEAIARDICHGARVRAAGPICREKREVLRRHGELEKSGLWQGSEDERPDPGGSALVETAFGSETVNMP